MIKRFWQRVFGRCFIHRYKLRFDLTERYNDGADRLWGSKVYACTECGKTKIVRPMDVL